MVYMQMKKERQTLLPFAAHVPFGNPHNTEWSVARGAKFRRGTSQKYGSHGVGGYTLYRAQAPSHRADEAPYARNFKRARTEGGGVQRRVYDEKIITEESIIPLLQTALFELMEDVANKLQCRQHLPMREEISFLFVAKETMNGTTRVKVFPKVKGSWLYDPIEARQQEELVGLSIVGWFSEDYMQHVFVADSLNAIREKDGTLGFLGPVNHYFSKCGATQ